MWIAICLLLAVVMAWFGAARLHRFAYWIDQKSEADIAALATGRWQIDRLEVEPGVTLVGLVRPPVDPAGRWVLFVPGNSTALLPGFQAELERALPDEIGVAFWAYRGFEASTGVPTPEHLLADLLPQWDRLRALGAAPERTEVLGYSLGSVLAVQLTAELTRRAQAPARLVLAAAGPRIDIMRHGPFGRFLADDVFDATAAAATVECPVVIVHGTADDALPIAAPRQLRQLIGDNATLHELPGKGHTEVWDGVRRLAYE
ncbi:MAG: alpha/beta hydrolase [Planctomycetes bacterium]|nr:alpha/beta hydrolase [Planctomycetota bacterium]